jgi:hypothetical protein
VPARRTASIATSANTTIIKLCFDAAAVGIVAIFLFVVGVLVFDASHVGVRHTASGRRGRGSIRTLFLVRVSIRH